MWRVAARCTVFAVALSLAACMPSLPGLVSPTPLPSATTIELTPSLLPPATQAAMSAAASPAATAGFTLTFTPIPSFTAAVSPTLAATITATSTAPLPAQLSATATAAQSISLDKLPRGTVYKPVHIQNQSHSQMDISLHCTTVQDLHTVLEYENVRNLTVQAPDCDYIYVVYVGGHKMSGSFSLLHVPSATIAVYADRVAIH